MVDCIFWGVVVGERKVGMWVVRVGSVGGRVWIGAGWSILLLFLYLLVFWGVEVLCRGCLLYSVVGDDEVVLWYLYFVAAACITWLLYLSYRSE